MLRNIKDKHSYPEDFERYKILRQHFSEMCDRRPKKNQHFWPTVKPFIRSKYNPEENIILRVEDGIVNGAKSVAKIFNEYFTPIASDIGYRDPILDDRENDDVLVSLIAKYDKHPNILSIKPSLLEHGTFEFKRVDINQIYQMLRNVNDKKATGYDGIQCKLLKISTHSLAVMLCKPFNISTSECRYPDSWNLRNLLRSLPFKNSFNRLSKENYRHVNMLTTFSKVFERSHSNQL